ncbi:glycosyltransferase family 9 protein [Noviherbaspirillum sp. ST9]|uniref:glycosyltransferase family 9 protein n=1 Tax=Noviherbaspirillum sp. ST9 TaxID=3401606 RepID=UPI003B58B3A7
MKRVFRTDQAQGRPQRTAFILLTEGGSMVLADPAVRAVAGGQGEDAFFVTFAHNKPALAVAGTVPEDRIFAFNVSNPVALLRDVGRWRVWLRRHRIDTIVDFELFSGLSAALCAMSGVHRRAGFHAMQGGLALYRGDLYSHKASYDAAKHIALNYLSLTEALLGKPSLQDRALPSAPRRAVRAEESAAARKLLSALLPQHGRRRLLLVNPNASEFLPQRRWPVPHFISFVSRMLERHADLDILLIGGPDDIATTGAIATAVSDPRCADAAGRLRLAELPALYAQATALLSNDSGPAHFASVVDLPVVVMFGPETPALYRPLGRATVLSAGLPCSPCVNVTNQRKTLCADNRCMREISVSSVIDAVESVLDVSRVVPLRAVVRMQGGAA